MAPGVVLTPMASGIRDLGLVIAEIPQG